MTGLRPGQSAITRTVRQQLPHTAPGWLTGAQQIRDAIPYDIDDQQRPALDQAALEQLTKLSQRMSPWDAAMTTFGGCE